MFLGAGQINARALEGFEFLEHPADLGLAVWAPSLDSLFCQAHSALTSTLFSLEEIEESFSESIILESSSQEDLMYEWLSEFVFLFDAEGKIFKRAKVHELEVSEQTAKIKAKVYGDLYDQEKYQIKTYVKAITMHQLSISKIDDRFEAKIFLDI